MTVNSVAGKIALGIQLHQMGRLQEAGTLYASVIALDPNHADASRLLGVIAFQEGRFDQALLLIGKTICLEPQNAVAHCNIGEVYRAVGRLGEAIASFREALRIGPSFPEVFNNLGIALAEQGEIDEAIPNFRKALEIKPVFPEALNNLGNALKEKGQLNEAAECYQNVLRFAPRFVEAHNNLGHVLLALGRPTEALLCHRHALSLQPQYPAAFNGLGNALAELGQADESIDAYRRAIQCQPNYVEALNNLAGRLFAQGSLDESIHHLARAIQLKPQDPHLLSNLIYSQLFSPQVLPAETARLCTTWNRRFGEASSPRGHFANPPEAGRRLRIGYVSPDFRDHVVGLNLVPLFRCHDHSQFEIVCFSDVQRSDDLTVLFSEHSDGWVNICGLPDDAVGRLIHERQIDILVDLTQHMSRNRLRVFAQRPAPVQVSFAGYPEGTGVESISYRLSDRFLEKRAAYADDIPSAEQVYLLDTFWCYGGIPTELSPSSSPTNKNGFLTFGNLNNFAKVTSAIIHFWARILANVPQSKMILLCEGGSHGERLMETFVHLGIGRERISLIGPRSRNEYLLLYNHIDIVLDTFPYNGHTTSLDALWMGVPVVSLCGERPVSRAGLSQLSNLGLPELVAFNEDQYVEIATRLANDFPRLKELRATLRQRMKKSLLMDGPHFARQIEACYRSMWRQWCESQNAT